MAPALQPIEGMPSRGSRFAQKAVGLLVSCCLLAACASTHGAQAPAAHSGQASTVHVAKGGGGGHGAGASAQGVANLVFLAFQVFGLLSSAAEECPSSDPVVQAVLVDGRVWTVRASGSLCSLGEGEGTPRAESLPEAAIALCPTDSTLAVLTSTETGGTWTLRQLDGGHWQTQMSFEGGADRLVALDCAPERITLLTSRRVLMTDEGATRAVTLSAQVPEGVATFRVEADEGFVSLDRGKLGSDFFQVDLRSGLVTSPDGTPRGDVPDLPLSQAALEF